MKRSALILACFALEGCAPNLAELGYENQSNLARLSVGMSKPDVLKIMGQAVARSKDGPVANPYRQETFQDKSGAQYEVLYYVTERNRRFQPLRVKNATPVVLKNGVVSGWGEQALSDARAARR